MMYGVLFKNVAILVMCSLVSSNFIEYSLMSEKK